MSHERIYYCKYTIFLLHTFFCLNLSETAAENYVHETTHIFDKHLYILYVMPLNYLLCEFIYIQLRHTHTHTYGHDEEHEEHEQAGKKEKLQTHYIIEMSCLLLLMVYFLLLSSQFVCFFWCMCAVLSSSKVYQIPKRCKYI